MNLGAAYVLFPHSGSVEALGFVYVQWDCVCVAMEEDCCHECVTYTAALSSFCLVWVEFHHRPGLGPIWLSFLGWVKRGLLG